MLTTIALGSLMIVTTVVIESFFISMAVAIVEKLAPWVKKFGVQVRFTLTLTVLTLWLLAGISVALWCWAGLFYALGEFDSIEKAIYFSTVSATTLGYGDLVLSERWHLLSGFIAANGLVLFSLNTAFLFEVLRRLSETPNGN